MSEENVEIVRRVYEAWNRGDLDWLLNHSAPDFEFRTTRLFPNLELAYRGRRDSRDFGTPSKKPGSPSLSKPHASSKLRMVG
jgi:ketosteroid isomerase-like protein